MTSPVYSLTPSPAAATGVVLVDPATGISYAATGGGGGGGAVTVADGADVTQGAQADAAYTTGSGSVVSILKAIFAKVTAFLNAQGSTTSGQSGPLVMGAVTTVNASYTNAQTSPLNLSTSGQLRVALDKSGNGVTQSFTSALAASNGAVGAAGIYASTLPVLTNNQAFGLTLTPQAALRTTRSGQNSTLNITSATSVKGTPGRVATVVLAVAGSTPSTIIDSTGTSATAANTIATIATSQVGIPILLDWVTAVGIGVVPGSGATVCISWD